MCVYIQCTLYISKCVYSVSCVCCLHKAHVCSLVASASVSQTRAGSLGTCPLQCLHIYLWLHAHTCTHAQYTQNAHRNNAVTYQYTCTRVRNMWILLTFLRTLLCLHTFTGTSVNTMKLASEPCSNTLYNMYNQRGHLAEAPALLLHALQQLINLLDKSVASVCMTSLGHVTSGVG